MKHVIGCEAEQSDDRTFYQPTDVEPFKTSYTFGNVQSLKCVAEHHRGDYDDLL
jgi:hypothetical protein